MVMVMAGATLVAAHWMGMREKVRMEQFVSSIAPICAEELHLAGHHQVGPGTSATDPRYLRLIAMEKAWLRACPNIADIYTMRQLADGTIVLNVDSETDYDRNGKFEGDREARTAIGEPFNNPILVPTLKAAFEGKAGFCENIYTDRWGSWVTAVMPVYDDAGRVDAILGVDLPADQWIHNILLVRGGVMLMGMMLTAVLLAVGCLMISHRHSERITAESLRMAQAADDAAMRAGELEVLVQRRTAELRYAALHDNLTGLANRALFFDRLTQAIAKAKRDKAYHFAVLFIDLDHFKSVNDTLGHEVGDRLLTEIGRRLTYVLRETDTVGRGMFHVPADSLAARVGGDEFCVLLDNLNSPDEAMMVGQRVLATIQEPVEIGGVRAFPNGSVGISPSRCGFATAQEIVRHADKAMYRVKESGRGRVAMFDAEGEVAAMVDSPAAKVV